VDTAFGKQIGSPSNLMLWYRNVCNQIAC